MGDFSFMDLWAVIYRGFISLVALFLITKMLGKKQVSQLSLFDYVIGISIGNFAAEITTNLDGNLIYGLASVFLFGIIAYAVSILTMKSIKLRRFFIGTPTILIDNGEILMDGLKKVKFDVNDLLEQCRINGYFDVQEIDYAILEVNGNLSIMPKKLYKNVTIKDMNLTDSKQSLFANVIIDGEIMKDILKEMNQTEEWLLQQLKVKGCKLENIILGTLDLQNKLSIYEKNVNKRSINLFQ